MTFNLNADGILEVAAKDNSTGRQEKITITNDKGRLSKADIDRMLSDAEKYRAEDELMKEKISARNSLETYIFGCKQAVEDAPSGKLSDADKQIVRDKCSDAMKWLDANNLAEKDEFEHHLKELQQVCGPIMAKMHGGNADGAQQSSHGHAGPTRGPTVEEVD